MTITYRRGTSDDSHRTFEIFRQSIMDLGDRLGAMPISGGHNPQVIKGLWKSRHPLFDHLAQTSDHFWVAEQGRNQIVGFARSILRDGVRQLTEFFVLPAYQSHGVGRELLMRAFPIEGTMHRFILATIDGRAVPRYLKAKVYPLFPCYSFSKPAEQLKMQGDITFEPIKASHKNLRALNEIDRVVLGYSRQIEHKWLIENRHGFLYRRMGTIIGYGYLGTHNGPFALLEPNDYPAILAHAENASAKKVEVFAVEVPLINRVAVDYLLSHGCKMDSFFEFFMSDEPFGRFENYILTSPPFFV